MINKRELLINSLSQVRNNAIGSITTLTGVKLTGGKKNPMQGRITKKGTGGSVMFFGNSKSNGYANMKNRRASKQDASTEKFVPKPRPWGNRINGTPLVFHKDKVYAECVFLHPQKTEYFLDGNPIAKSDIEGMKKSSAKGSNDVILRTINIDNITTLKMGELSVK